ncbi:DNA translocase FtsK 4TM domain-containing protein [Alteromonas sp. 5E99-2]|uniref:DNA translocase FtsK n=1 Tax=Alteromonas sp. 5E99-2 TaxID=2817683 RepID=UPI001A9928FE|nr:DNA translocase FtsK [Alteromonas sp. 5E99-2]MBO1255083.1 DNA translocase FtsK 4TM domain-containing protein [Alteromonas sp. 5E99-2]
MTAQLSGWQRLKEVGMILMCAFAFFLLLALSSFHPSDPGWSQAGLHVNIQNWVGKTGAWCADLLYFTLGYLAFFVPLATAIFAWFLFQFIRKLTDLDYLTIALRILGVLLIIVGATGTASINFDDFYSFSAGGLVGDVISSALIPYFNTAGTILLLLCFLCTGFTLTTGISWMSIIDKLGASVIWFFTKLLRSSHTVNQWTLPFKSKDTDPTQAKDHTVGTEIVDEAEESRAVDEIEIEENTQLQVESPFIADLEEEQPIERIEPVFVLPSDAAKENELQQDITIDDIAPSPAASSMASPAPGNKKQEAIRTISDIRDKVQSEAPPEPEGIMPSFDLLDKANKQENPISQEELDAVSRLVESKLADFNIEANVVGIYPGPVITRFELDLAPGIKVSKITGLSKDLARAMSAISVRVVEVIPGKSVIGLELPNKHREMVRLSEVLTCKQFTDSDSALTMVLGADISGKPVVVDLAKMPHVLVAGTTGSGKSVGVNVMILSLLYKSKPEDVRMIMIDPKMLELSVYEGIPHLLAEVVTDMKEAANALRWCVGEMERRYKLMSALGVRNLKGYNAKVLAAKEAGEPILDPLWKSEESMDETAPELDKLPAIVVVVDEFADMMMIVGKKVEELIARIAQKARAAGIHLVLATQRPSVDVITGLIKANIPTRIAFQVSSKIDSRTILDQQGAEALLGMGDMLYLPPGNPVPTRVHGAFVDDHEVHAVVADWKLRGEPEYIDEILDGEASAEVLLPGEQNENADQEFDVFYDEAVSFVTESRRASVSSVQRKFRIGYNRAARLVEQMESSGVVSAPAHNGNREVLAPPPPKD